MRAACSWGRSAQDAIPRYCFDVQMLSLLQAEEELREAGARQALQLQEMGRRERLLRDDLARAKQQVGMGAGMEAAAAKPWGYK